MRAISFYTKLAAGNLWRNKSTYAPYLLACVVSIFTFYTLLAINMNGALDNMRGESIVKSFTAIGTILLAMFCSVLIFYTNSFLIKRRKRELGLYSILGMEKRNIGILMLFETLFIAGVALVLGLLLGLLLSRLILLVLLRLIRFPVTIAMPVMPQALGITALFFGAIFLLTLLSNLRQVRIANPIDLMAGAKQGEKEPRASWLLTLLGLACVAGGYFLALYFQSPIEAILLFLVAALLVIIGTYCLFTSGSIALLKLLRKNKKYYYTPDHFISVSGMIYRMKQNAAGLATICILSCMVLVTVSATVSLNVGADDSLATQYPYEYQATLYEVSDGEALLAGAREAEAQSGASITGLQDYVRYTTVARQEGDAFTTSADDSNLSLITMFSFTTLEAYNRSEGQNIALGPGEALLFVTGGSYDAATLTLDGIPYSVRALETLGNQKAGTADLARSILMILPDEAAITAALAARPAPMQEQSPMELLAQRTLAFDLEGTDQQKQAFLESYDAYIGALTTQQHFSYRTREGARDDWYATNGGFLFLGIYFGILFLLAAALIIYYKQISEGYDDADRFEILQKVGMSEEEVKRTINRQILTVFFLPLVVAVVHIAVAFWPVSRAMVLFSVINLPLLALTTGLTIVAYALIYLLVFRKTAGTYFRIVRRQGATS